MEKDRGVVLATERYGSAESWKYFGKDGVMERRRDESDDESRGYSVVAVFKVRTHWGCMWPQRLFTHPPPPTHVLTCYCRVSSCLKAIQRVSVTITCSTSSGIQRRYMTHNYWDHKYHHRIKPPHSLSRFLSGFLQLAVRHFSHAGLSERCRCWKPRGDSSCCHNHLVT